MKAKAKSKTAAPSAATAATAKTPDGEVAVYQVDGEGASLAVRVDKDTIWLTQAQMAILFGCDRANITQHLKHIFADGELDEKVVCKDFLLTTNHGAMDGKTQSRMVAHYNLDAVISVGFRVNSKRGIAFRQWANGVIRDCMLARLADASAKKPAPTKRTPCAYDIPEALYKPKSTSICAKCLFGRLVRSDERGTYCECHIVRPTSYGFPIVRPDDFCGQHVNDQGTFRTFAAVLPEPSQSAPALANAAPEFHKETTK